MWSDYTNFAVDLTSIIHLRIILYLTALALLVKYIKDIVHRDPRFVKFAETIPGPYALPIVGNSLNFLLTGKGGPLELQREYFRRYGSTYKLWIGKHLHVALSDPQDLQTVFHSPKMLGKSEIFIEPFHRIFGDGLVTVPTVDQWRKDRKYLQPFFINDSLKAGIPVINDAVSAFMKRLKKHINEPEFDIGPCMFHLSHDVITRTTMDRVTDTEDKLVSLLQSDAEGVIISSSLQMFLPLLNIQFINYIVHKCSLNSIKNRLFDPLKKVICTELARIEQETFSNKNTDTSIKSLLSAMNKKRQETGNEKKMFEEIFTILIAGTETTAVTMSFTLLMVAMRPEIQEKLYREIYEIFGDDDRLPDFDDIQRLTYLDQVIKETQRRFTLTPFLFRKVENDSKIGSRVFPAGIGLIIDMTNIHFNPEFYPEPYKFNPENFNREIMEKRPKYSFVPFSAGPRICIGKNLAEIEMRVVLVTLLRSFSFHTSMTMESMKITCGFAIHSANGYRVSIKRRNSKKPSV